MTRTARAPMRIPIASFLLLWIAATAAAQARSGDYVLLQEGTQLLNIQFKPTGGGAIAGSLTSGANKVEFTGTMSGNRLDFTMTGKDGNVGHWQGTVQGDQLALTLTVGQGSEHYTLTRRGAGWSDDTPLAKRWRAALAGKAVWSSANTSGGSSGGVTSETWLRFCADGSAILQSNTVVSIYIPEASGSRVSQSGGRGRWRVITQGSVVAVEFTADEGTMQIGVREGTASTIYAAGQRMILRDAGSGCS